MAQKNIYLDRKPGLYLKSAGKKGRGVFCRHDIKAGEILEVTPAIVLDSKQTDHADKTALVNYTFVPGELSKPLMRKLGLKSLNHASSVVMGMASFCNHGPKPNAEVIWMESPDTLYYVLRATRNIPKNTEICTSYGDGWFDDRD